MTTPWRHDPALARALHPDHPDDLQVIVHDGEPPPHPAPPGGLLGARDRASRHAHPAARQQPAKPVTSADAEWHVHPVYRGVLLNQPHHLLSCRAGDTILFLTAPGLPHPLSVTEHYLAERQRWAIVPCNACGADQTLDPPTVTAALRFPGTPAGSAPVAFTAFCPCGG
jgi:hypothetical protein